MIFSTPDAIDIHGMVTGLTDADIDAVAEMLGEGGSVGYVIKPIPHRPIGRVKWRGGYRTCLAKAVATARVLKALHDFARTHVAGCVSADVFRTCSRGSSSSGA